MDRNAAQVSINAGKKQRLATETSKLKLAEATQAAREIMFGRQRAFEFRDKPSKCLMRLLSEEKRESRMPACMINKERQKVKAISNKLQVFVGCYEDLYKSSSPEEERIGKFLDNVTIPKMMGEHRQSLEQTITAQEIN